ncbi:MAG: hypothetical protein R3E83_17935 [Burkholderiaceae bacterium]
MRTILTQLGFLGVGLGLSLAAYAAPKGTVLVSSEKDDAVYILKADTLERVGRIATHERPRAMASTKPGPCCTSPVATATPST